MSFSSNCLCVNNKNQCVQEGSRGGIFMGNLNFKILLPNIRMHICNKKANVLNSKYCMYLPIYMETNQIKNILYNFIKCCYIKDLTL